MIGDGAHKEILQEDYEQHRQLAEKFRNRNEPASAAAQYRKCADILEQMTTLESSEKLATRRAQLAENLSEAAERLEATAESETAEKIENSVSSGESTGSSLADEHDTESQETESESSMSDVPNAEAFLSAPPDLDFDDVGGMTELKQELFDKIVDPLERSELYDEYDLGVVNGVLLYGPPGTGKTYLTRALAGKLGYNFVEVTPADITSSLVGEAADNVADLYEVARNNQPCIVFIDEVDAIAGQRSGGAQKTQSERQIVNQLLTELSSIQGEDIVVIAATNLLEVVDDAIKRSGRFDERIEVPPPDPTAREAILRIHLRNRPVLTDEIDWKELAAQTEGYVASDLELIATTAARKALQDAQEDGEIVPVTQTHLRTAIDETDSSLDGWDEENS